MFLYRLCFAWELHEILWLGLVVLIDANICQ